MLAHLTLAAIVDTYRRHPGCSDAMLAAMIREWAAEVYTPEDTIRAMGFPDARWEEALPEGVFTKAAPPVLQNGQRPASDEGNVGPRPCGVCQGRGELGVSFFRRPCGACRGSGISR